MRGRGDDDLYTPGSQKVGVKRPRGAGSKRSGGSQQQRGRRAKRYKGVTGCSGAFTACIEARGRFMFLGTFRKEVDAARAHDIAALHLLGPNAVLNLPTAEYHDSDGNLKMGPKLRRQMALYDRVAATHSVLVAQRRVAARLPTVWMPSPRRVPAAAELAAASRAVAAPASVVPAMAGPRSSCGSPSPGFGSVVAPSASAALAFSRDESPGASGCCSSVSGAASAAALAAPATTTAPTTGVPYAVWSAPGALTECATPNATDQPSAGATVELLGCCEAIATHKAADMRPPALAASPASYESELLWSDAINFALGLPVTDSLLPPQRHDADDAEYALLSLLLNHPARVDD